MVARDLYAQCGLYLLVRVSTVVVVWTQLRDITGHRALRLRVCSWGASPGGSCYLACDTVEKVVPKRET